MKKINYGIELLRIVSMIGIVTLHILGHGGAILAENPFSLKYWILLGVEIFFFCSVNCYALISGYIMSGSKIKMLRLMTIWIEVLFYSIIIWLVMFLLGYDVKTNLVSAIFPVFTGEYWYVSSYVGMYLCIPILNCAIKNMQRKQLKCLIGMMLVLVCGIAYFTQQDPFRIGNGESVIWLCILFLVGAYIKKYNSFSYISNRQLIFAIILMDLITLVSGIIVINIVYHIVGVRKGAGIFISYISPTIVIAAIAWLCLFSNVSIKNIKICEFIKHISRATFGVYLIHDNPLIRKYLITDCARSFVQEPILVMMVKLTMCIWVIFIVCVIIDILRRKLFGILKIDKFPSWLEKKMVKLP